MVRVWGSLVDPKKKALINTEPPPGYIAGLGRGATPFTTRSDIGPAINAQNDPMPNAPPVDSSAPSTNDNLNDAEYDEFAGYSGNLCGNDPYEADDAEADSIYASIDARMDEKRRELREIKRVKQIENIRRERPKIQQQFVELKRDLSCVTEDQWNDIPEVADWRNRAKRNTRYDRLTAVPDSVIGKTLSYSQTSATIDPNVQKGTTSSINPYMHGAGFKTPLNGGVTSMARPGDQAKNMLMDIRLNEVSDSVTGQTVIDPKGYLTSLQSMIPQYYGSIDDVKKARLLLKSVREINPRHAPGWIASARIEEVTGKLQQAQVLIMKGCEMCPKNEDVWLEAIRLMPAEQKKKICTMAVSSIPNSVKIWCKAADLEDEDRGKQAVLRKALAKIPNSVRLWKLAVDLEDDDDAKVMLSKAVECCPTAVELWLALAKLENYENARKILNKARENIPTNRQVWITAAKLEETNGNLNLIPKIIQRAIQSLSANQVKIERSDWFDEASDADLGSFKITAQTIIQMTYEIGIEKSELKNQLMSDANHFSQKSAYECSRAIYDVAIKQMPKKSSIYFEAANFENEHGDQDNYELVLTKAVEFCPKIDQFWLMLAKSIWKKGEIDESRRVLEKAFEIIPDSEDIWLAAVKIETQQKAYYKTRDLLAKARQTAGTARIFMKSAWFEWCQNCVGDALKLIDEGISKYPEFEKFYLMKGQILTQIKQIEGARIAYNVGLKIVPESLPLWVHLAKLEESAGFVVKARSILERARLKLGNMDILWKESVELEARNGQNKFATQLINRGLQACPKSGRLWTLHASFAEKTQRNQIVIDAVSNCEGDPYAMIAVCRLFLSQNKIKKAKEWFEKGLKVDSDCGDIWVHYYSFIKNEMNSEEERNKIVQRCQEADPRHGDIWASVVKNPKNWLMTTENILEEACKHIQTTF